MIDQGLYSQIVTKYANPITKGAPAGATKTGYSNKVSLMWRFFWMFLNLLLDGSSTEKTTIAMTVAPMSSLTKVFPTLCPGLRKSAIVPAGCVITRSATTTQTER